MSKQYAPQATPSPSRQLKSRHGPKPASASLDESEHRVHKIHKIPAIISSFSAFRQVMRAVCDGCFLWAFYLKWTFEKVGNRHQFSEWWCRMDPGCPCQSDPGVLRLHQRMSRKRQVFIPAMELVSRMSWDRRHSQNKQIHRYSIYRSVHEAGLHQAAHTLQACLRSVWQNCAERQGRRKADQRIGAQGEEIGAIRFWCLLSFQDAKFSEAHLTTPKKVI